ncbi:MAG: YitT family protein [Faecalibacterium sp.]
MNATNTPRTSLLQRLRFFVLINFGLLLCAIGIAIFKSPNNFAFGGTSGISIILSTLIPALNVGQVMWIVNLILVVLGFAFLGKKVIGWTIYSSFALSALVSLCEVVYPLAAPLTDDTLLELCFAVLLPAIGSALLFNMGASTGGTDIIAMILQQHTSLEIGRALMVSDALVVAVAAYLYGPATGLYCVLGLIAKALVVDVAIENINLRKVCTVITPTPEPVRQFIITNIHRSATMHEACGAYTQKPLHVLTSVMTRREAARLRNFLHTDVPNSFITIVNSSEIIGKGFRQV